MKTTTPLVLLFHFFITFSLFSQNAPALRIDYDTADVGATVTVNAPGVLANDTDLDGDALTVTSFSVGGTTTTAGDSITFSHGVITINADGSYVFEPTATSQTTNVDLISYVASDGTDTRTSYLIFSIEETTDLLEIGTISSCNQGYTADGFYTMVYSLTLRNTSTARDLHQNSIISNIDLVNNLDAIFGSGCASSIDDLTISTNEVREFTTGNNFPQEFDDSVINPLYETANSNSVFNTTAINLYPRQTVSISFCINIDPLCNGRDGSSIDFDNIFSVTSDKGNDSNSRELTDFHITEANVTAALYIPDSDPEINPNATYDYTNTIIITNDGSGTANDVNYNMGLGDFITAGITFDTITVQQLSGPTVAINNSFNGDTNTKLLTGTNPLATGETIILSITYFTEPASYRGSIGFRQMNFSQSEGGADGTNETANEDLFSYVSWSDGLGNHVDRYYEASSSTSSVSSTSQCDCTTLGMSFDFTTNSSTTKTITNVDDTPNGIPEQEEITFQITIENTSDAIQLENLQLIDNLSSICGSNNIISITTDPFIESSNATTNPSLNLSYNGIGNNTIFDGTSGVLLPDESITIEFTVLFYEDCDSENTASFSFSDPLGTNYTGSFDSVNIDAFTDYDGDGIYNSIDIDDDNDTIPDTDEYNGLDPLGDPDNDYIPNYRDTDNGPDSNNDGVVDIYDFDNDGVPNHFDIDSDNDGIYDLVEVNNENTSGDLDGIASLSNVGINGLHNDVENNDSVLTTINYTIPNTDNSGNENFIDIDSDDDGIVDNIEGQTTFNYIAPSGSVNLLGMDVTSYSEGITPIDNDGDTIADYIDTNSDNDLWDDNIEGWDFNSDGTADTVISNNDADNDGLDNAYDNNDSSINPTNGQTPDSFPDVDNTDNPEKDWREIIAINIIMGNTSATEGNNLDFPISLVRKFNGDPIESTSDIIINFSTTDVSDNAGEYNIAYTPYDYTEVSSDTFTINAFNETATFPITSIDDSIYELDELFTLNGTVTSGNTYSTEISATGTITDNEPLPSVIINNAEAVEGDNLTHSITLSHPSSIPIAFNVSTSDNEAISTKDYTAVLEESFQIAGTINENASNTQVSFTIPTLTDNTNEQDEEELNVNVSVTSGNVSSNNFTNTGTILDIDPNPTISITNAEAVEGNDLEFTISILNTDGEPMFNYENISLNLQTIDYTAIATEDYKTLSKRVIIVAETSAIEVVVNTIDDKINEEKESLQLNAETNYSNIANLDNFVIGIGTIKDDDIPNLFTPNDDGVSDVFKITGLDDFPDFKITIFDRWGNEIYNYSNNGKFNPIWWDGTSKGKKVPEGVYYYTLEYNDGETEPKTNFIQLSR